MNPVIILRAASLSLLLALPAAAQYFPDDSKPSSPPAAAEGNGNAQNTVIVNREKKESKPGDMPHFDPGSEIVSFGDNGKLWNISNQRMFRARFEKYLAAPEADMDKDTAYRKVIDDILAAIAPGNPGGPDLPRAVALLPVAAQHPIDARLCDSLANAIYTVWVAKQNAAAISRTDKALQDQLRDLGRSGAIAAEKSDLGRSSRAEPDTETRVNPASSDGPVFSPAADYARRIAELQALRTANVARRELNELEGKLQFQSIILQYFIQRRFEHVLLSSRIYRIMFSPAEQALVLDKNAVISKALGQGVGQSPTVTMLDALANESIRDVDEAVDAFTYLSERGDLDSATKRLSEAFFIGEYLPKIRTLPRKQKDKVLDFVRDSNKLVSAMEVRDFTTAKAVVEKLKVSAKDFDATKPAAAVDAATKAARDLIAASNQASLEGNRQDAEAKIREAREIWPNNPALDEVTGMIESGGRNAAALKELESLVRTKNYRAVLADQQKYSAAVANLPEYKQQLADILEKVRKLDSAVREAELKNQGGDPMGAWEMMEIASREAPNDPDVNRLRGNLAPRAASLAEAIDRARRMEESGDFGPALGWYLKAESIYRMSLLAREGIDRASRGMQGLENRETPPAATETAPVPAAQ